VGYNIAMKKLLNLLILFILIFSTSQFAGAEDYKVLVLPDNIQFDSTNYFIFPDSSVVFASDTINEIKKNDRIQTVSMTEVRDALRKNTKLSLLTKRAMKEFKYNYNISFVDFSEIANKFSTNKILIITSQTDTQNYLLRRSFWDIVNFPGESVVNPAYKLATYAALIDVDKEVVIWQKTYYKTLGAKADRILAQSFAPATEQLKRIKTYSTNSLSPDIAKIVQLKLLPPLVIPAQEQSVVNISNTTNNEISPQDAVDFKPKAMPIRQNVDSNGCGLIINDI